MQLIFQIYFPAHILAMLGDTGIPYFIRPRTDRLLDVWRFIIPQNPKDPLDPPAIA